MRDINNQLFKYKEHILTRRRHVYTYVWSNIQANMNTAYILCRIHAYFSVRSILLRCKTNELKSFKGLRTSYIKINGIYDEDTRILIKLVIELALFSEEKGDQGRENQNNELGAQRNYQRALNLCALVRTL
ncbi:unnamed protein product [Rotaria socialis]|uniref:Uncharacterized protein n=1 Tax=Rotaria socialis TaxID=392032 RepID=A0A820QLA3_9BILA|nr:unnamed protein product [Rotaria socialis]CAF3657029.1 unnamed protein product [Rotaria socialis]CAF4420721.1 unnamed protein product [Rotaria socialis]CAF4559403.1 unnamed protein product [Rotaria socialis]